MKGEGSKVAGFESQGPVKGDQAETQRAANEARGYEADLKKSNVGSDQRASDE